MSHPLNQLTYLALDCQTTGNNPQNYHLLEIGWSAFRIPEKVATETNATYLIRPANGEELPRRIQRLTGLEPSDFEQAVSISDAMAALLGCIRNVTRNNGMAGCPTVIHYARFELAFLQHAFKAIGFSGDPPIDAICTHQIATRLIPHLPRKGLRAVAGYMGHSVPTPKRCGGHLQATRVIWRNLVNRLASQIGIETLDQLHDWLKTSRVPDTPKRYAMPETLRKAAPAEPGIYYMQRANGDVLYIGKAANLKQRVNSYFHQSRRHPEHVLEMLTQAKDLAFNPAATALEAALMESDAIKQWNPPYNIALTPSHRRLFYLSRNFDIHDRERERKPSCPLGPVPAVEPFAAACALGRLIQAEDRPADIETLMAMPLAYCPDMDLFAEGLSLFRAEYNQVFAGKPFRHAVLHIGHESWLKKMEEKNHTNDAPDDAPEREEEVFVWTAERVAHALEAICRRCGFLLRRARWFHLLKDAQVAWQIKTNLPTHRLLTLRNGAVVQKSGLKHPEDFLNPSAAIMTPARPATSMDLATYDRLRVLTTELRRLLGDERLIGVRRGRRIRLLPGQLRRLLLWI